MAPTMAATTATLIWVCQVSEIDLMLQADMTPMQIIVAAINNAAQVCNPEDRIGTLEPGKIADIKGYPSPCRYSNGGS